MKLKSLIISEKPSVARDIAAAIGGFEEKNKGAYYESDEFVCTYAVGHILSLLAPEEIDPKYKRWRLQDLPILPEKFDLKPIERQEQRLDVIKRLMERKDVGELINACDAAREGELIFREIVQFVGTSKPIKRLWLQSMTKDAIRDGFKKLRDGQLLEGLAAAAACRSYSDWLIGMNATRALTVRLKTKSERGASWSAGRVQTPTLALLVRREQEIMAHIPKTFHRLIATFQASDHEYEGFWIDPAFKKKEDEDREDRIFDLNKADGILKEIEQQAAVASETRKPRSRKAPLLFDLTSLQREANNRFSWSASRTLKAAQRCYEAHKVLTYPRTSSKVLPEDYRPEVQRLLEVFAEDKVYGPFAKQLQKKGLLNDKLIFNDAGVTDHFAIVPTGEIRKLEGDDAKLFDLVTRQFLAAFYPPAIYEDVERLTVVKGHHFKSKPPQVIKDPGWLAVFEKAEEASFPPLKKGHDQVEGVPTKHKHSQKDELATKPPPRIGEAKLLSLMENAGKQVEDEELSQALQKAEGLGTAATRADIIENLKSKEYVDPSLRPTVKGIRLIDVLERIKATAITSAELTAKLELELNEVEGGKRTAESFLDRVKQVSTDVVEAARGFDYDQIYPNANRLGSCPKCKSDVFEKAWFYGCVNAMDRDQKSCSFMIWKDHYGRYIDRRSVELLLVDGKTGELDGFKTQSGNKYKAVLSLEAGELVRSPVAQSEELSGEHKVEVDESPLGACPVHKEGCKIIETKTEFICEEKLKSKEEGDYEAEGFSFPRILCKRMMTREEIIPYIQEGQTAFLEKFISKKGRPFSAKLVREAKGGFRFEFPERAPKKKKDQEAPSP
jgi:DNA topoisomerase III